MMRSLYSGVSGLRVHQTKMDVLGNNISNVNTVGFKSSSVTFSDILYQTTQSASGPNAATGVAGTNAKQIGLGATLASITANIGTAGGAQRTDNAFDIMIEGDGFFVVNNGNGNYFTRAGSFQVDANGTLCTPTGATVMGWQAIEKEGETIIKSDNVSALKIMAPENLFAKPEATLNTYLSGNIDMKDTQLQTEDGRTVAMSFYDKLGNLFQAQFKVYHADDEDSTSTFRIALKDVTDSKGDSIFMKKVEGDGGEITYETTAYTGFAFGPLDENKEVADTGTVTIEDDTKGTLSVESPEQNIYFNGSTGEFFTVGAEATGDDDKVKSLGFKIVSDPDMFETIDMDFSALTMFAKSGTSSVTSSRGSLETGAGAGCAVGEMSGVSVDSSGKIFASYDNGVSKMLGQIVVATFANPAGLEAIGNNMYAETQNSGQFDGVGQDITNSGGSFESGVLEMSNVDLSQQFTEMITTQRGFQANSRIITTSDTLLEELINLKR